MAVVGWSDHCGGWRWVAGLVGAARLRAQTDAATNFYRDQASEQNYGAWPPGGAMGSGGAGRAPGDRRRADAAYVRRPHDELLRAVLDPAVPASRLVVVRGGSSTGKTRAAYEAVADRLADWQLDYPLDPGALAARLDAGIPARTVLWLGELRQYADADGGPAVLGRLADLLDGGSPGHHHRVARAVERLYRRGARWARKALIRPGQRTAAEPAAGARRP